MNEYECDKAADNAAEYLFIREREVQAEANGQDAIALWQAVVKPILYTTLRTQE